ncbi:MAG TPA: helix-turn-helix transcriptional regulator, partial [Longimicrobiales bacterium]|nr:helix-turn-helix transcriptional regulator [Longimicrobiales bacterium]
MHVVQTPDAGALARRLAARLEEKGWTYKEFQQRVREAAQGARGTSYGSVWSYVNGEVAEPRPRVLQAMADVLGLSTDWLVSGAGPRTRKEAARRASE